MSDRALRAGLIRLAHANPELRKDLLPLITASAEDEDEKKDDNKGEEKKASAKVAGTAIVRRMISVRIRVAHKALADDGVVSMTGLIGLSISGGAEDAAPFRFEASAKARGDGTYEVISFAPVRAVMGPGVESLTGFYRSILAEALAKQATALLGATQAVETPVYMG